MPTQTDKTAPSDRLGSWKAIADHLGRSARTIQRWHAKYEMPVHRLGGPSSSVFAFVDELEAWLRGRNPKPLEERPGQQMPHAKAPSDPSARKRISHSLPEASTSLGSRIQQSKLLVTRALKLWEHTSTSDLNAVIQLLREAIDLDCDNASAYAWLAQTLILGSILAASRGINDHSAAKAALAIAAQATPTSPETECAAAWAQLLIERDGHKAHAGFEALKSRGPIGTSSMVGGALLCIAEGRPAEASRLLHTASNRSPLSGFVHALHAWACFLDGQIETAGSIVDKCRTSGHRGSLLDSVEALIYSQMAQPSLRIEQIATLASASGQNLVAQGALGYTYGRLGETAQATSIYDALTKPQTQGTRRKAYAVALLLLGLDEPRAALKYLEESCEEGSLWSLGFRSDPMLASLRSDPDLRKLMESIDFLKPDEGDAGDLEREEEIELR